MFFYKDSAYLSSLCRVVDDTGAETKLTVYLLHSLPLRMSVVQVFVGDRMACVGHLVTEATVGRERDLGLDDAFANARWRAMIIKDDQGDWALCAAALCTATQGAASTYPCGR